MEKRKNELALVLPHTVIIHLEGRRSALDSDKYYHKRRKNRTEQKLLSPN
jgi:hypothetical protein